MSKMSLRLLRIRHRADRQWVNSSKHSQYKQIYNAAKRLVAKIVHKAKSLFLGNEIANATSSKQLFNVCGRLIGRERSSLPSLHPIHDLPDVFNHYFVQKVKSIGRADLDQQSMLLMSISDLLTKKLSPGCLRFTR